MVRFKILITFLCGVFFSSTVFASSIEKIEFETSDQVRLFGNYMKVSEPKAVLILLPMLSKTKGSWKKMQEDLAKRQFSSLAVDLRGHGESRLMKGREIHWKAFSDKDFQKMTRDVQAVFNYLLQEENIPAEKIFIMGASIGANAALKFAATESQVGGVLLLSPGLNYRGIKIEEAARRYGKRPIFLSASREDMSSFGAAGHLSQFMPNHVFFKLENVGHGTDMLKNDAFLSFQILEWLNDVTSEEHMRKDQTNDIT